MENAISNDSHKLLLNGTLEYSSNNYVIHGVTKVC